MVSSTVWTFGSVLLVSLLSLVGAASLLAGALRRHRILMSLVALAAGTLVGDTFFHILPEAAADGFDTGLATGVVVGFVLMFVLEVALRWGHSHVEEIEDSGVHAHTHPHSEHGAIQPFGWLNLIGDGVHNFLDGVVIAAAYLIDVPLGIATTIAVAAHEIPQELGDFAVLLRAGMRPGKALLLNLASGLTAMLGVVVVLILGLSEEMLGSVALPLIAGGFLYIAAADLIPELHHHSRGKDAYLILGGLLLGIALMAALLRLESLLPA